MQKKIVLSFIVLVFGILFISQISCKKDEEQKNQSPNINDIVSTPNTSSSNRLPSGEQATITVTASDPDKDKLSYTWEADGGNFIGETNQSSISWISPISISLEEYYITATVSDGAETVSRNIKIYVDKVTPGINAVPKTLDFGAELTETQVKIFNVGEGELSWETSGENASWLTVYPTLGTINSPNDTAYVTLTINRAGLDPDSYSEGFLFKNSDDNSNSVSISVSMEVSETADLSGYTFYASTTIPVSGVLVSIGESSSTTGGEGLYELTDIQTGNQTLSATKDGYDTYSTNIQVESGTNEYNIEITSAEYTHNLFGVITSSYNGNPIENVWVVVLNPDGTESGLKTQSDFSGNYQIPTVPQGQRIVKFYGPVGYDTLTVTIFMANSDYEYNAVLSPTSFEIGGIYNGDMTLYELNSPYYVVDDVEVSNGTLTIEAGVDVIFTGNFELFAKIDAFGTEDNKINFYSNSGNPNPNQWKYLELKNGSNFYHTIIKQANSAFLYYQDYGSGISTFENIVIENCNYGIKIAYHGDPEISISNSSFSCSGHGIFGDQQYSFYYSPEVTINGTYFNNCGVDIGGYASLTVFDCNLKYIKCGASSILSISNSIIENSTGDGIHLYDTEAEIINCKISNHIDNGLDVQGGVLNVSNCDITGNNIGIKLWSQNATITKVLISNNNTGIYLYSSSYLTTNFINFSNIYNNWQYAVDANYISYPGADYNVENNWWGQSPPDPTHFHEEQNIDIDYDPWLTSEVTDAGYQGGE